ncbi:MAG: hypothetical protein LBR54_04395 [Oscillospiraceae bacterium]|jgi:hypothetical protein|nr:hypothetical protein [Oscillospiraceae bacterium]
MNKLVFELNTIEEENEEQMTEQIMWLLRNSSKIEYYSDMIFPGIGTAIENIQYKPLAEKLVREAV